MVFYDFTYFLPMCPDFTDSLWIILTFHTLKSKDTLFQGHFTVHDVPR